MATWRPLGEIIPNVLYPAPFLPHPAPVFSVLPVNEESTATILGKMGCGCLVWIGLLVLAIGGGVVFPVLLILLPIALIGGTIDMVKKLIALTNRRDRGRRY